MQLHSLGVDKHLIQELFYFFRKFNKNKFEEYIWAIRSMGHTIGPILKTIQRVTIF
jgi:hypothetical protein